MRATHTWRRSTALESTTNVQAVVAGRSLRTTFTSDSPGCVQYQNPTQNRRTDKIAGCNAEYPPTLLDLLLFARKCS